MSNRLFRNSALERLSTPDRLDELMVITTIRSWLLMLPFAILCIGFVFWAMFGQIRSTVEALGYITIDGQVKAVALQQGIIDEIFVENGQLIAIGQPIVSIALPMNNTTIILDSLVDGTITSINVHNGDLISIGSVIAQIQAQSDDDLTVKLYVPAERQNNLSAGLPVEIMPNSINPLEFGSLSGVIKQVNFDNPLIRLQILQQTGDYVLYEQLNDNQWYVSIIIELEKSTDDNYKWSLPQGQSVTITSNETISATIIIDEVSPFNLLFKD